ncbi:hypothetical protein MXM33_16540 [Acinetobacter vivianii]|uniref:hypothetical protein n=1 Tax=Acinetobacter vivianii TaxID=1776742 RepID=UPI002DBAD68B|nr:hypothetical protein [Acinetobacter vivianii]MEB6668620.1 hypothetical protein [Acinetobacter vivianii]
MNDIEKFQFKLELILNLKSAKDIQDWATNRIEQNITDSEALEICFFSKEKQVLDYFYNIKFEWLNLPSTLKKIFFREALRQYIEPPPTIEYSEELIRSIFRMLLELSKIAEDEDLYGLIDHYDDELYLILDGIYNSVPEDVWPSFINDLRHLLSIKSLSI